MLRSGRTYIGGALPAHALRKRNAIPVALADSVIDRAAMRALHLLLLWPVALTIAVPLAYPQSPSTEAKEQVPENVDPNDGAGEAMAFAGGVLGSGMLGNPRNWRLPRFRKPLAGNRMFSGLRQRFSPQMDALKTFKQQGTIALRNKLGLPTEPEPSSPAGQKTSPSRKSPPESPEQKKIKTKIKSIESMKDDQFLNSLSDEDARVVEICVDNAVSEGGGSRPSDQ